MYVIGIDVGTSGVKSTVFDEHTNVLHHAYREYNLICDDTGVFELDPSVLFEGTLDVLAESTQHCNRDEIRAICVTSFGESFVCFDENDNILGNTMIYMDQRGAEECEEFKSILPETEIFSTCGQFVDKMFAVYKLRWLQKNRPQMMEKVKKLCFITDFITHRLGASHTCEYSLAARSAMFDVKKKCWWDTAVQFAGIDKSILPSVVPSGSVTGTLSPRIASLLNMPQDVKLIVGGHDQIFAAIGSGAREAGDIANGMGTVDCMISVMQGSMNMEKLLQYKLPVVPYLDDNKYVTYAFNMSGGCTIKWFRDTFAKEIAHLPDAYNLLNGEIPSHPTSIYMLPYFAGGGTPYMDAKTPAALVGMRLSTTRGDLFRAFMEGESYEMKLNIDCLIDAGIDVGKILTVGGGSQSPLWMQIRADIFGRTVYVPRLKEAGTIASAILCYANIGIYKNIAEAQANIIQYEQSFDPQPQNQQLYQQHYQKYLQLYKSLKEFYL